MILDSTADVDVTLPDGSTKGITLGPSSTIVGVLEGSATGFAVEPGTWKFEFTEVPPSLTEDGGRLDPEKVEDMVVVLGYSIEE